MIAHPTSSRSPSHPESPVRGWSWSPCAAWSARSASTGSLGNHGGAGTSGSRRPSGRRNWSAPCPLRGRRGGAGDRAARGSTAWSGLPAPGGARDGPRRTAHDSRGSGKSGPDGAAPAAAPAGSSAFGPRPPPPARPRRAASPPGSRRTPAVATFPWERAARLRGPIPRPDPHPPGPRRLCGPPPDTGPRGIPDRARDVAPPRPARRERPPAAAAGSERWWRDRWPAGCSRWPGAAGTASHELPRARAGAARRPPGPGARGARRCRPHPHRCGGSGPHADAQHREPRAAGLPGASLARCAPRGPLCPRALPRAIGPRYPESRHVSGHRPWRRRAAPAPEPRPSPAATRGLGLPGRAPERSPGQARHAT